MFTNMTIKARLISLIAFMSVLLIAIGVMGLWGMGQSNLGLKVVYEDRTIPLMDLGKVLDKMNLTRLNAVVATNAPNQEVVREAMSKTQQRDKEIEELWNKYMAITHTPEEKNLADTFDQQWKAYQASRSITMSAASAGNFEASRENAKKDAGPKYNLAHDTMFSLIELQGSVAKEEYDTAQSRFNSIRKAAIALILIGVLLGIFIAVMLIRNLSRSLGQAGEVAAKIAAGDLSSQIKIESQDEVGQLLESLKNMQQQLHDRLTADKKIADESLRIKIGLDNVSTGVMIADTERNIIYVNKSVVRILGGAEADIRKQLPNFSVANLVGTNIDSFHKNPSHQKQLLANLNTTYTAKLEVGGRSMVVSASPVINEQGQRLGSVAEWQDRTAEVAVEKEVAGIVEASVNGDFTKRIAMQGKEGFFKQLGEGINQLMQTSETGLNEVVRVLNALSRGDLTEKITNEYSGTFGQLKDDSNTTVEKLKEIIGQIKDATDTINTASKEIASGNSDLSQRTEEQASSLEETASSMEELTSTVKQNAENAKQANQLAIGASDVAGKGGAVVGQVVATMDSINESSRKIVDIISVIDGIAFQTNILALNAAVEAARAGEQGRGFAVVAGEVRNLAQRSAAAAKEIKTLIGDSVEKVEGGSKLVAQAGQTMEEIVTSIRRVTDIMSEITAASQEQSQGIEQVNTAITQMDEVTQQNAALVEEAAAAAESLEEQAQNLSVAVATFKLDESGSSARRLPAPTQVARRPATAIAKSGSHKGTAVAKPKAKAAADDADGDWKEF